MGVNIRQSIGRGSHYFITRSESEIEKQDKAPITLLFHDDAQEQRRWILIFY